MDKKTGTQNIWFDIRQKDTHPEAKEIQRRIWLSKTDEERFALTLAMLDMVHFAAESSIKNEKPYLSVLDLKIETFKRMYKQDYTSEKLEEIINWMRSVDLKKSKQA